MKIGKLILVILLVSAYATITVVHINMAQPKPVAEATLDMIEIMTRAFDESEGGEGGERYCIFCRHFIDDENRSNVGTYIWNGSPDVQAMVQECESRWPTTPPAVINLTYSTLSGKCELIEDM